jgi:chemotaxis protein MotB
VDVATEANFRVILRILDSRLHRSDPGGIASLSKFPFVFYSTFLAQCLCAVTGKESRMSIAFRMLLVMGTGCLVLAQSGCNMVPRSQLAMSQNRARQLSDQNRALLAQQQALNQQIAGLSASKDTLQSRLDNLMAERSQLGNARNPLPESANRQFADLERRFPGFEFDPQTGVSRFSQDVLFNSGSDEIRPEAVALLSEFAKILNTGEASQLNVLVAGHTDNQPVKKASTKAKHPNNWYLSAHRSIAVVEELKKHGLRENRMGQAGYAEFQPRVTGKSKDAMASNRRVEIYVLAPGASTAGRDPNADWR